MAACGALRQGHEDIQYTDVCTCKLCNSCISFGLLMKAYLKVLVFIVYFKRSALSHMKPMSLSLSSPDRPASLSHNVLEEIENFLHSVVR